MTRNLIILNSSCYDPELFCSRTLRDVIVETDGIHTALNGVLKQNIEDTSLKHLIGCLISAIINA